jgi:SpoVK/Ycf46/Vps4 family AAA+-type ATPase
MATQRRKRAACFHINQPELSPLARLWILRVLCTMGGHKEFIERTGFANDDLARQLGLGAWLDCGDWSAKRKLSGSDERAKGKKKACLPAVQIKAALDSMLEDAEKAASKSCSPEPLKGNIEKLVRQVGLSRTDMRILEFAITLKINPQLEWTCDLFGGELDTNKVFHCVAAILAIPKSKVCASLHPNGLLAQSGLLALKRGRAHMDHKMDLISYEFADSMASESTDLPMLMRNLIVPNQAPTLTLNDYAHLSSFISILLPYVKKAVASRKAGLNVLLYGAPGTGKSELARVIAKELGCALFEISSEDSDGDPRNGEQRLRSFRAAQHLFSRQKNTLLVFDEVEDVFRGDLLSRSIADRHKAWVNRMLENNPVPAIWLSNHINRLDPAFVRRFDLVSEVPIPPTSMREKILAKAADGMLDARALKRLAESEHLSPGVVTRSVSVVKQIQDCVQDEPAAILEGIIGNTMKAQGFKRIPKEDPARLPDVYDPAFINTDMQMAELASGIKQSGSARLCLYGPPGTGKTAFGRWLAEQMQAPLLVRRASDIFSMWLGESEKNIARAFEEAQTENAVLLIDEVDSFLRDRNEAKARWEQAVTNEMLTQMEAFPGVFIASTNLMDGLDEASLRRFDLKLKFQYLRPAQSWEMFQRHCANLSIEPTPQSEQCIKALPNLAPGDFAAVIRQCRFHPIKDANAFARALSDECAVKRNGAQKTIGFV